MHVFFRASKGGRHWTIDLGRCFVSIRPISCFLCSARFINIPTSTLKTYYGISLPFYFQQVVWQIRKAHSHLPICFQWKNHNQCAILRLIDRSITTGKFRVNIISVDQTTFEIRFSSANEEQVKFWPESSPVRFQ